MQFDPQSAPNSPQRRSKFPASNHEVIQLPKPALLGFVSFFLLYFARFATHRIGVDDHC